MSKKYILFQQSQGFSFEAHSLNNKMSFFFETCRSNIYLITFRVKTKQKFLWTCLESKVIAVLTSSRHFIPRKPITIFRVMSLCNTNSIPSHHRREKIKFQALRSSSWFASTFSLSLSCSCIRSELHQEVNDSGWHDSKTSLSRMIAFHILFAFILFYPTNTMASSCLML